MSTSILIDRNFRILNSASWIHPLTLRPLNMLGQAESVVSKVKAFEESTISSNTASELLRRLIEVMLAPLKESKLVCCERMSNLRLHGYSDFQLRFEVISILYGSGGR
ncbi:Hypothetical predicted protein [Lecanosticta acicola]|uniref:Uncharacterized protein n=1 Tax=Lecanosticta acicola TaxID=111012 RepID=A0AAI9E782_9PEZI|nr:Hypothetical predicted protein [Lecanosticta acicola]